MKARYAILLAILFLALASIACGGDDFAACTNSCRVLHAGDQAAYGQCYQQCQVRWQQ